MDSLICVQDFELEAAKILPRSTLGYINTGATTEKTLQENQTAIQNLYIRPRCLVDVSSRDLSTTILGHRVKVPFGISPTAIHKLAHPDGECATAKAASRTGCVFTLSSNSSTNLEDVTANGGDGLKFFQLYIYKDRKATESLVRRAEKNGYKGLVLTIDCQLCGIRYADLRNNFSVPPHVYLAHLENMEPLDTKDTFSGRSYNDYICHSYFDQSLTWKEVSWLKSITTMPIILKGILTAEDALLALESGAEAIWVSNHGARQVDTVFPTIDALEEVVDAIKGRCEIYVDGGFRTGTDVFKALALGAQMVFIGRPLFWGLSCGGEDGAFKVLQIFKNELDNTMANSGCASVSKITRNMITRKAASKL